VGAAGHNTSLGYGARRVKRPGAERGRVRAGPQSTTSGLTSRMRQRDPAAMDTSLPRVARTTPVPAAPPTAAPLAAPSPPSTAPPPAAPPAAPPPMVLASLPCSGGASRAIVCVVIA